MVNHMGSRESLSVSIICYGFRQRNRILNDTSKATSTIFERKDDLMFKNLSKYDVIAICAFALVVVLWLTCLTVVMVHDRMVPTNDIVVVATPDEATPDEVVPPKTETVEVTECTTVPEITEPPTVEPSMPVIAETKPTEPDPTQPTTKKPSSNKKPSTSSNKTESNKKPSKSDSTATKDTPSKGKMSETEMLACVIYQEVGGSKHCDECRRRVADVVLNRVADPRFPNSIEKVLTAKSLQNILKILRICIFKLNFLAFAC